MIEYDAFPLLGTAVLAVLIGAGVFWGNTFLDREIERREAIATIAATFFLMAVHVVLLLIALAPAEPISPTAFRSISGVWTLLVVLVSGYFLIRGYRIRMRDAQAARMEDEAEGKASTEPAESPRAEASTETEESAETVETTSSETDEAGTSETGEAGSSETDGTSGSSGGTDGAKPTDPGATDAERGS